MPENDVFIDIGEVGQWLPIPPSGAVVMLDRGSQYGTDYKINCITGEVRYTVGTIDEFRYIILQANTFGGGDAPNVRQDYAVWGPAESFSSVVSLNKNLGQGSRNSILLTSSPLYNTPSYKDYTHSNGTAEYKTCWFYLHDFNRQWNIFKDWFIPSSTELTSIIQNTLGNKLYGFLKWGWIEASSEYSATAADNCLITDGSVGTGADKLSLAYGRFYAKYLGGEGLPGPDINSTFPSGATGGFPEGADSIRFKRLQNQASLALTHKWGSSLLTDIYVSEKIPTVVSGVTATSVGAGVYLSKLISLGTGLGITVSFSETTDYWGDSLWLFSQGISKQTNSFSMNRFWEAGTKGFSGNLTETVFIPSRDELMLILNSSRGKAYFNEGEEFWSSTDTSASQAYSVTYHENSEPTVNTKDKTSALGVLVCRFYNTGLLPKVADPIITVEDVTE